MKYIMEYDCPHCGKKCKQEVNMEEVPSATPSTKSKKAEGT